ncbi:hypothetical protein WG66_012765 [Moniliophthora roreri]|nr:hypothetical protein WG66_012765 [Moniliophthora roreri]
MIMHSTLEVFVIDAISTGPSSASFLDTFPISPGHFSLLVLQIFSLPLLAQRTLDDENFQVMKHRSTPHPGISLLPL